MKRIVDISTGLVMVITDLHGAWEPYVRYRDRFLQLLGQGKADRLLFLGDLIHGQVEPENDRSLDIILDVLRLREELGHERVGMLLGNHELPHIYGLTLSKGDQVFTPRFETALGEHRDVVLGFFRSLPFMVRTAGGVLLAHAGAAETIISAEAVEWLSQCSHELLIEEAERLIAPVPLDDLVQSMLGWTPAEYLQMVHFYLDVSGRGDPRYADLLRGVVISEGIPAFRWLWDAMFTRCEQEYDHERAYKRVLERFLEAYSTERPLRALVTGHITIEGGYKIVADRQLRVASWTHARPHSAGMYLLLDAAQEIASAKDLVACLHPLP